MRKEINRVIKKLLAIILIVLFLISITTISLSDDEGKQVIFSFNPIPKIDIILAKQRTTTDVTNFEADLLKALQERNIDKNLVQITSVETENVNFINNFPWEKDVSGSIGSITISQNGKDVVMCGNPSRPGKNAIWIIPEKQQEQEFNFSYNIDYGDSFNAAGMLLRVERNGNTLSGYMLSFNNSNWVSAAGGMNGAIWEFSYNIGANSVNMTKTLKQGLNINKQGTLNVKVDDNQIEISGGGLANTVTYILPNSFGNGYGFFSDHYSHDCSSIGSFTLQGINLKTTIARTLAEVLREPTWRKGAIKALVNVNDMVSKELDIPEEQGKLLARLLNENAYYIPWGKDMNREQHNNVIKANNEKGKFINNTSYKNSIEETAEYIKEIIGSLEPKTKYLLLDEEISVNSSPSDILKNTIDSDWPYGKWKITHDYTYYENNIGQFLETNKYLDNMVDRFDKTGKYNITYQNREISPKEIYVHRRPKALIEMKKNGNDIELISNSYDLDEYSRENNGISQEEWKYKRTTDSEWTNGKLESLEGDTVYLVQLRVKDYQETWSNPESIFVTAKTGNNILPIAAFDIEEEEITKYEDLEIVDKSYDPTGKEITSRIWEVTKGEDVIYKGSALPTKYSAIGTYKIKLIVKNSENKVSESYTRRFKVVEDRKAPSVIINPLECDWKLSEEVSLSFYDDGKSGLKNYKYSITDSQNLPNTWSENIEKQEDTIVISEEGRKYLHIITEDNEGNISKDRVSGEYLIDRSGPDITIDIDTQNIVIDELIATMQVTDKYSGIKIVKVGNREINLSNFRTRFRKNGTYEVYTEDNIGNTSSQTIVIRNIYYECKAGLNHPIYSSDYDKCPICEKIKNLDITTGEDGENGKNQSTIYDGNTHKIEYENPDKIEIVEYYNGTKELPKNVGEYEYELKVVYEDVEYETGLKGKYTIFPRELTIEGLKAVTKKYDRTEIVELTGGELTNTVEGDDIRALIPKYR